MNEVLTLLKSTSGHSLVKSFRGPDLTKQNFSIGNSFQVVEEQVSDLNSLSNVLQRLENEPTHTIPQLHVGLSQNIVTVAIKGLCMGHRGRMG